MGLGQIMLSILALGMFGRIMLGVNTNSADHNEAIKTSEYLIMGTSLGTSLLERAQGLSFDEQTITADVSTPASLSTTLGAEGGEGVGGENLFDDFDDYNNFAKTVQGDSVFFKTATFTVNSFVDYVDISGGTIVTSGARTYHKRLRVVVASPNMEDTLRFSTVYSYWYFR
jgi:hypothetical protein